MRVRLLRRLTEKVRLKLPNRRSKRRRKPFSSSDCSGVGRSPLMTSSRSSFRACTCTRYRAGPSGQLRETDSALRCLPCMTTGRGHGALGTPDTLTLVTSV